MIGYVLKQLLKTNDGKFMSEKQACLILGQCEFFPDGAGYVYHDHHTDNTVSRYFLDSAGVNTVIRLSESKQSTIWQRRGSVKFPIQNKKAINKRLDKLDLANGNAIKIQVLWDSGTYKKMYEEETYASFYKEDVENNFNQIAKLKQQLRDLGYYNDPIVVKAKDRTEEQMTQDFNAQFKGQQNV